MFSQKKIICSSSLGLTVFWEFEDADSICSLLDRDVWCDDVMFGPPFTFTLVISLAPGKFWFARAPSFLDLTGSWDSSIYNPNLEKKIQKKIKIQKKKKRATGQIYHRVAIFENSNCSFNTSKVTRNSGSSMQQNKYYGEFSKHKPHLPSDFFPVFRTYVCYSYQATWWTLKLQVIAISVRCLYPTVHCFRLHLEFSWVNKVAHYFIK